MLSLESLSHNSYRGLKDNKTAFSDVNHIIGKNGSGKTSLIEAVVLLLTGRSFQGARLSDLTNKDGTSFAISGNVNRGVTHRDKLLLNYKNGTKAHTLNGKRLGQQYAHTSFPLCLIDNNIIHLSSGKPNYRRDVLDRAVFHVEPEHARNHKKIKKCLLQRNKAITSGGGIRAVQSWDDSLAELGEKISRSRAKVVKETGLYIESVSKDLLGERLSIDYRKGWEEESYIESLKKNIRKDLVIKRTTSGPQKDDYRIMTNRKKTKHYYSHGQEKLASLSFMIALNLAIEKRKKEQSIIIIDEVESGLDNESRQRLVLTLKNLKNQLLITSLPDSKISNTINGNILTVYQK